MASSAIFGSGMFVRCRVVAMSLLFAACQLTAGGAGAQTRPAVAVKLDGCDALPERELRRVLAMELATETGSPPGIGAVVTILCQPGASVLQVRDDLSRKVVQRRIEASDLNGEARARLLAIAAAELVIASWAELDVNPAPRVEPSGPPPQPELASGAKQLVNEHRQAARKREEKARNARVRERVPEPVLTRALALVTLRRVADRGDALWGGGVRVGQDLGQRVSWTADTVYESGTFRSPSARHEITSISVGGALLWEHRMRPLSFRLGAGLRLGVVQTKGDLHPRGSTALVPWGWPLATASVSFWINRSLALEVGTEGSYARAPLSSGSRGSDPSLRGLWFGAQAGVGLRL